MTQATPEHSTHRVSWAYDEESFIGTVAEMQSLWWRASNLNDAFERIRTLFADVLKDMLA